MRLALDSSVLVYAEGVNGDSRKRRACGLLARLSPENTLIPVQALGELFRVLVGKAKIPPKQARAALLSWRDDFDLIETSPSVLLAAADLSVDHKLNIWDAVILAAAASADCRLLLSEDMQAGFTWNGVTVVNPFAAKRDSLLENLLGT